VQELPSSYPASAHYQTVDRKQNDGADQRHDEPGALPFLVEAYRAANPATQKSSGNSQQHGNDDPAGIFARHDQLGQRAHHKTNDQDPQEMEHASLQQL
jgi:hypothetical protein